MSYRPEPQTSTHIEHIDTARPTLATFVRASYAALSPALSDAFALLARNAGCSSAKLPQKLVALKHLGASEVDLVASIIVDGASITPRPSDYSEIPAGRYLTLTCAAEPSAVACVLPTLRDWLGEHHEYAIGPLLLQVAPRADGGICLATRLRVQRTVVARRPGLLAHEGQLETTVAALVRVSSRCDSHPPTG